MAHTDISPGQFIKVGDRYKLNDFNRARFLRWNVKKDEPCGYYVDRNPGRNRSPEEYSYKLQSEKVCMANFCRLILLVLRHRQRVHCMITLIGYTCLLLLNGRWMCIALGIYFTCYYRGIGPFGK